MLEKKQTTEQLVAALVKARKAIDGVEQLYGIPAGPSEKVYIGKLEKLLANEHNVIRIYGDANQFNQLTDVEKAMCAGQHASVMRFMLEEDKLHELESTAVSVAVMPYVLNTTANFIDSLPVCRGNHDSKNEASDEVRCKIVLEVAKDNRVLEQLNPAAQIVLLAMLKDVGLGQNLLSEAEVGKPLFSEIQTAHVLSTKNPAPHAEWWWALVGDFGVDFDEIDQGDLVGAAYAEKTEEAKALAEVVVRDSRFVLKPRSTPLNRNLTRFDLAKKHAHIALLLVQHPEYRGMPGEITEDDLDNLAEFHGAKVTLALAKQRRAEIQALKSELDTLKKQKPFEKQRVSQAEVVSVMGEGFSKKFSETVKSQLENQAQIIQEEKAGSLQKH